jgi:hypothetical protein
MSEPGTDPGRLRLDRDLASGDFESGVGAGLWRLVSLSWPYLTVTITAGDGNQLAMRILIDGYPRAAPGGEPWNLDRGEALPASRWPTGGTAGLVFRPDWSPANKNAPYMACDRTGLAGHPGWANEHPARAWNPSRTIAFYLREVHHELRSATLPRASAGNKA